MAADDKFIKAGYGTATTLSAPGYTSGVSTTVNVASTATWPTTTDVIFAIDEAEVVDSEEVRVEGTYNVFQGTVDTATSIIDVDYIGGDAERSYSAGALTRVYILSSSYLWDRLVDALLISLDQDGTLKAGAVDVAAVLADNVVTTAKILDANVTNAKLSTSAGEIGAAWQSWTPTLSGRFTDADWTKDCKYIKVGKTVHFRMKLTSTDATPMAGGSTDAIFTLPVTAANYAATENSFSIGTGGIYDASPGAIYPVFVLITSTTVARIRYITTGINAITSTAPMTWTTSDEITFTGTYEAA